MRPGEAYLSADIDATPMRPGSGPMPGAISDGLEKAAMLMRGYRKRRRFTAEAKRARCLARRVMRGVEYNDMMLTPHARRRRRGRLPAFLPRLFPVAQCHHYALRRRGRFPRREMLTVSHFMGITLA